MIGSCVETRVRPCAASLFGDGRGAASVFVVFFACVLVACVFGLHASYEALAQREHLQDAADAAAFASAVVHAKGMNLVVLIHVVMAALLAIVVGLRLVEALGIAAMGICTGLSVPTYGASLAYLPTLADLTSEVHDSAEEVRSYVEDLLPTLHDAAVAVRDVMPLASNLKVLDLGTSQYGVVAAAIPTRSSLPLVDGDFGTLCRKAGDLTGGVVGIPFAVIPPVRAGVDAAVSAIVAAGPAWFCGDAGSRKPRINQDAKAGWVSLPKLEAQQECESMSIDPSARASAEPETRQDTCALASIEMLAAAPARDGSERVGEPLCPTACEQSQNPRCPAGDFPDCTADAPQARAAQASWGSSEVQGGETSPYQRRVASAREACSDDGEHAAALRGFAWVERSVTRTYRYQPERGQWQEDEDAREAGESHLRRRGDDDASRPCGVQGFLDKAYEADSARPLCRGGHHCLTASYDPPTRLGPCLRRPPGAGELDVFREEDVEVLQLLGCGYQGRSSGVTVPDVNLADELGGNTDGVPLALDSSAMLGGSDFQVRGIALAKAPKGLGLQVAAAVLGQRESERDAAETALGVLDRIAVAQAEHYFDWSSLSNPPSRQTDEVSRVEWMWNMGWTARLRAVHGEQDDATDDDAEGRAAEGAEQVLHKLIDDAFGNDAKAVGGVLELLEDES